MTTFKQLWPATTPEAIASFELKTGLQLPQRYRQFLLTTNGGSPTPDTATVKNQGQVMIGLFFGLRTLEQLDEVGELSDIASLHAEHCDSMPAGCIPIADDPGGNLFLLETHGDNAGQVWFWERIQGFWSKGSNVNTFLVESDFDKFVASLTE